MATIPELLDGHITLEVECLDRLYLNGYIGKLATGGGLVGFMRGQLEKPVPSPVVLGQVSERFREAVKALREKGLVEAYSGRGTFITDGTTQAVRQSLDLMVKIGQPEGSTHLAEVRAILEPFRR